jgi:hypothetical protein
MRIKGGHSLYIYMLLFGSTPTPSPVSNILKGEVSQMFAAPRLFGQTKPIQSAGVSGSRNIIIPRWRPNKNKNERQSPQCELNADGKPPSTGRSILIGPYL